MEIIEVVADTTLALLAGAADMKVPADSKEVAGADACLSMVTSSSSF
jgi:hypothetical protein